MLLSTTTTTTSITTKKRELTPQQKHRMERKQQWQREYAAIAADFKQNPQKYRLYWHELPPGVVKGLAKWTYASLYRPPFNYRKCRHCDAYVTSLAWYVDIDGRERCKLCGYKVAGPQWSRADARKRPLEGSHCVVIYTRPATATPPSKIN